MRWFHAIRQISLIGAIAFGGITFLYSDAFAANSQPTHKQARAITPMRDGRPVKLHTFCVGPDNNLWMCCDGNGKFPGAIMVYDGEGELLKNIPLSFVPQAINFSPEGTLFVSGSGKIARVSKEGEVDLQIDAPNIGNKEEALAALKKEQEKQLAEIRKASEAQLERIQEQIEKISVAPEGEDEKAQKRRERRLKLLKNQLDQFKEMAAQNVQVMELNSADSFTRWERSTGLCATDEDVFVSLPQLTGYGYGIWRLSHNLTDAKLIKDDASGCCGQLDIQTDGENLLIAENTKFQVGFYDREGKRLNGWGKRARNDDDGFGSCCNPMNVRCCANGEILTAESSIGHIKRYSQAGEYLGIVGTAKVAGGCKHVAIGFDAARNWHYMMNEDRSHVAVLVPREMAPAETEDERLAREAVAAKGKFLFGTWEMEGDSAKPASTDDPSSMVNYIQSGFAHMEFSPDGSLKKGAKPSKSSNGSSTSAGESNSSGVFGSVLSALTGSTEQATQMLESTSSKWAAIQLRDDKLDLVTIDEGVQGFGATVEFLEDDKARFTFFYGDPSSPLGGSFVYKRIALEACGKDCKSACGEGNCEKEEKGKADAVPANE